MAKTPMNPGANWGKKDTSPSKGNNIPLAVQKQQGITSSGIRPATSKLSGSIPPTVQGFINQSYQPKSSNAVPDSVKKQQGIDSSGIAVSGNLKPEKTKIETNATAVAKPKRKTTTKVVITLPDGVKTTGYINPKDNRTYYDKDFTKPVTTKGAKVTKITSDKREDFTKY
jgi:hypothetical protein